MNVRANCCPQMMIVIFVEVGRGLEKLTRFVDGVCVVDMLQHVPVFSTGKFVVW